MKLTNVIALLVLLVSPAAIADPPTFDHLQIDTKTCNLVESGSMNKNVKWKGALQGGGLCSITVPSAEFGRKYSHCALTGVIASPGSYTICEFGWSDREKTKVFFSAQKQVLCEFVCVKS